MTNPVESEPRVDKPSQGPQRPLALKTAIPLVLGALYLPTLFGFLASCSHCRQVWLFAWPVLPGAAPVLFVMVICRTHLSEITALSVAAILTFTLLFGLIRARRASQRRFAWYLGAAALINFLVALAFYGLLRA